MNSLDDVCYKTAEKINGLTYLVERNVVRKNDTFTYVIFTFHDSLFKEEYQFNLSISLNEITLSRWSSKASFYTIKNRLSIIAKTMVPLLKEYFITLPNFRIKMAIKDLDVKLISRDLFYFPKKRCSLFYFIKKHNNYSGWELFLIIVNVIFILFFSINKLEYVLDYSFSFLYFFKLFSFSLYLIFGYCTVPYLFTEIKKNMKNAYSDYLLFKKSK